MTEFYITHEHDGQKYLAIVVAPARPARWQFEHIDALQAEMDGLGHEWQLLCQIEVPQQFASGDELNDWQQRLAEIRQQRQLPKPDVYLAGQGGGSTSQG
jgi:hypothetical protein